VKIQKIYSILLLILFLGCEEKKTTTIEEIELNTDVIKDSITLYEATKARGFYTDTLEKNLAVKGFFNYIDSVVCKFQQELNYPINEHILVRANPWIIDTLTSLDYYRAKANGKTIFRQDTIPVLRKGQKLLIPDSALAAAINDTLLNTVIDVNIPEFKLRIYEYHVLKHEFLVRVGKNEKKFLVMAGREVDLKTPVGVGEIVRLNRDPYYVNPTTGKRYFQTRRDDNVYTKMPIIPWIEPTINGIRHGSLIHPTTNENTLGKPYSSGCVGTKEADAWIIYYSAPIGTKVVFRYDLMSINTQGDTLVFKDINNRKE
jgi:L,D-transpeptidase ErfK/SrfK